MPKEANSGGNAGSATLYIVRIERDLINDTSLYEAAFTLGGTGQQEPHIRQFYGEQPLMDFLQREVGIRADRARQIIDQLRRGEHERLPVDWSEQDAARFGFGNPRKAA